MKHAETVTFGGSGLDRNALLRADSDALDLVRQDERSTTLVFWRGKPLIIAEEGRLKRLPLTHTVLQQAGMRQIYLGREDSGHVFASDISNWEPDNYDPQELTRFFDPSHQQHPKLPEGEVFAELRGVMSRLSARDAELAATSRAIIGWHRSHRYCAICGQESEMAMAGWQRDCPACGGHHFPRTDPVVIMLVTKGNKVLIGRSPGWPEGMYSLLAGFVEPGESLEAAVRREVMEEAGIEIGDVRYLAGQPWPYPSSLMVGCHGEAISEKITLDPAELDDGLWVSREEVMQAFAGDHPKLKPARKGSIAHFILRNWLADRLD